MLTELSISNIAIIDSLHVSFSSGLTALTGETGAGKSIIIDAVSLIMGERASLEVIRSGCDEASVEALFDISVLHDVRNFLLESGFEAEDELIIKRVISRNGKSRVFINGSMATLAVLNAVAKRLINIYGQHESQTLLRPENQLYLLDLFAGSTELREVFSTLYADHQNIIDAIEQIDSHERENARKLDLLLFQSKEIEEGNLTAGEEENLEEQHIILSSAEKRSTIANELFDQLYSGENAILGTLRRIKNSIYELSNIDPALKPLKESLEEAFLQLEDVAITVRDYSSRIDSDPRNLQKIEDRLDQLHRLKRKYGATVEDVLLFKKSIDIDLENIQGSGEHRQSLENEKRLLEQQLQVKGRELSQVRAAAALKLQNALAAEAQQLAMKDAVIVVNLESYQEPKANGFERMELLFSPNPGEPPRPMARIASGGELSRLMLAFKQVLPECDVSTLIFDEVDTGISGATSELVGRKLKNVASRQQVLCITHLPQVASFADHHLLVKKTVLNQRTTTSLELLDTNARIKEIARLLAGEKITDSALANANEMLQWCKSK